MKLGIHSTTKETVAIKIISKQQTHQLPTKIISDNVSKIASTNNGEKWKHELQLINDNVNLKPRDYKKLEREITIMKIIDHPNVLRLLDVYETDNEL